MKSLEDFEETLSRLRTEIDRLTHAIDSADIDDAEMKAVRMLQLLEFEIGTIGQEMYEAAKLRRAAIRMGEIKEEINEDSKRSNTGRTKRQSNNKTKRASK